MIDSKKMGRFIVEKRKALGLTQTQLGIKSYCGALIPKNT